MEKLEALFILSWRDIRNAAVLGERQNALIFLPVCQSFCASANVCMSFQPRCNRFHHCAAQLARGVLWFHLRFFKAGLMPTVRIQTLFSFSLVCKTMEISPGSSPFLCMDLTYITILLQELGFPKSQVFKVMHKMDCWGEWAGWCRGSSHHASSSVVDLPSCSNTCSVIGGGGTLVPTMVITGCDNLQHCIHLACFSFSQRIVLTFLFGFFSPPPACPEN